MSKTPRISPARTEKARKAAIAEIQARLDAPVAGDAPHVGPTPAAAPKGAVVAKAGSPKPPKPTSGPKGKKGKAPKAAKPAKAKAPTEPKAPKPKKDRPMSGLDAAAKVLLDAGKPLRVAQMMEAIVKKGVWKSNGKTPEATLYAAIIREIAAKGANARFEKKDRGVFVAVRG